MLRVLQKRISKNLAAQCTRMVATGKSPEVEVPELEESFANSKKLPERGMNKVTLVGRVGRVPEQRGTSEHPAVIFPLATNMTFKRANGELTTRTDWHRVCVFLPGLRNIAANRVNKGDRLLVEGSLSYQRYTDSDNKEVNVTSILANNILILSRRPNQVEQEEPEEA
ncbi:single-stranded DNA-binding protein mitochondrial [Biomphalaria glabrata]|uniref:Single-stranded DNA-binding protein, mitochondrial-like n=1 Tax=Biomphalaria glabrata TaxID=6526 RepID=A0A9U8EIA7_BIOGL|nr:single-stranded DNA-binding protein, mitochondrial-like [Biomphalaria glabrata]KAI8759880.1 single-stranded DNA-binding protein; mitochondrial-like [Biomphalaria glabrata]